MITLQSSAGPALLPKAAKLWGGPSSARPGESPTLTEAQRLRERLLPPNSQRTHIQGIFVFWWCLFFKPTRSLGSAGKQDILREGRWLREQIPLQLWREAPGPCSREGGPAASSQLARARQRPFGASVPSSGELSSLGSASSQAQPEVSQQGARQLRQGSAGSPESLSSEEHWLGSDAR